MSADAWRPCPRCFKKFKTELEAARKLAEAAYGKEPAARYREMVLEVEEKARTGLAEDTFREDYSIGTQIDGKFSVGYYGQCTVDGCGYVVTFKHSEEHTP